jgi:proline dehydrogenase
MYYMEDASHSHSYDSNLMERLLFKVARKWVAGFSIDEAMAAAKDANAKGMSAILNFLGEETTKQVDIETNVQEYLSLIDRINSEKVNGCVSAKPTQLGLAIDYELCLSNYRRLAAEASELGQFMWIDMESIKFTEETIAIYMDLFKRYNMTGIAMQSYLRRTASDLLHVLENGGKVRVVKGAYHESEEYAFSTREEVDANYSRLMKTLHESGNFFAIATHDSKLVDEAISLSDKANVEFQLLMGIRDELKRDLVAKGYSVSEYIPYGAQWLPYSVRRLRERKRNLLLLARSLVQD